MVIRFDQEEEDEEDEDKKDEKQSISLSQIDAIYQSKEYQEAYVSWLTQKWFEAQEARMIHLIEELKI